jgi:type II secretory pathway component GspD/PulD (secretin)
MRTAIGIVVLAVGAAIPVRAATLVQLSEGRVDVQAEGAPLAEVLDRLAETIGMRVVYDGFEPREAVTVSLRGRTPLEAVNEVLKDRKVNYALAVEPPGQVRVLILTGPAGDVKKAGAVPPPAPARAVDVREWLAREGTQGGEKAAPATLVDLARGRPDGLSAGARFREMVGRAAQR